MLLTPYGRREWLMVLGTATAVSIGAVSLRWWWLLVPAMLLAAFGLWFFRDPRRRVPTDLPPGTMLSPCDGVVSAVLEPDVHEAVEGPALVVRVFLSVLDVHVNRAPCDGVVESLHHRPGRYLDARKERSAAENESNLMILRRAGTDETVGVRQIAGLVARRIVCPVVPGDALGRGQRYGMIKFGSTTELIVPRREGLVVHVREGERVHGGLTALVTLPD